MPKPPIPSIHTELPMSWPAVAAVVAEFVAAQQLPQSFIALAQEYYFPLAQGIAQAYKCQAPGAERAQLVAINGAQGTGKSTLAALLKRILEQGAGLRCAHLSIDDVYLTRTDRSALAQTIHPLLQTRGVPGTHDLDLALDVFGQLLDPLVTAAPSSIRLPRFNKALDDREQEAEWYPQPGPVNLVLFEGWCVGARPQSEDDLALAINDLEAHEDAQGIWRGYVNSCLASSYQTLFARFDYLIMIKAPAMDAVLRWRWEQEQKLFAATPVAARSRLMDQPQIARFIQHYERLTRHMLEEMPQRADLVYHLNEAHGVDHLSGPWAQLMNAKREAGL